ncbi:MAG: sugar phosphate isomerase/epimerase [Acidobacteria bacterium]|nr:sugar phosphate isomerase/epimerase [Acidobacteriota bacterium]
MNRRRFLASMAAAPAGAQNLSGGRFIKSVCGVMFPDAMPWADRMKAARNAGFDGIELSMGGEITPASAPGELKRLGETAQKTGIAVASLWVSQELSKTPLNSPDAALRARGVETLRKSIDFATWLNCGALLIVPGRVGSGAKLQAGYEATWQRFTAEFRKLIPHAGRAKVLLTPENVWNKFLLSPLEMRSFVDQFQSPWVQTHFDVGNVMEFGYPQDWIETLGPRIKRLHVKDFKLATRNSPGRFVDLLEGDVDWKAVMAALVKTGYRGFVSPEAGHKPDDPDQIAKVSRALDKILGMAG